MRVAVIGAGLFGCTAAIHAARAGHDVTLFDKAGDIMTGATRVNQFRLHRGYHYPRSDSTVAECLESMDGFMREYGDAVVKGGEQYYAIARGSRTSAEKYVDFMNWHGLKYELVTGRPDLFNHQLLQAAFRVEEHRVEWGALHDICKRSLIDLGIRRVSGTGALPCRCSFDKIIVACYAGTNEVLNALGCERLWLQYERVEKPVVTLPERYKTVSAVLMDGEYGCVDPHFLDGQHQLGHVHYAVHDRYSGMRDCPHSAFGEKKADLMRGAIGEYLPFVRDAKYVKSNFVTRVVLPGKDATDERPTLVRRIDDQVLMIFSGKLGHAVRAAEESLMMLEERAAA